MVSLVCIDDKGLSPDRCQGKKKGHGSRYGANDEVLLTATAQNLRRLIKFLCRPPPSAAVPCAA